MVFIPAVSKSVETITMPVTIGILCSFGLMEIYGIKITFRKYLLGISFSENIKYCLIWLSI